MHETNRIELKQALGDNIEKEVVAFVNTDGGEIHIGVRDDGEVVGVGSGIPYIVRKYGRDVVQFMSSVIRFNIPFFEKGRVESRVSRVESSKGRVESQKGRVENPKSRVEIEDSRVKNPKSSVKILLLIEEKPTITAKEIAEKLNLTLKTIEKHIKILKTANKIRRIGANKGGYWEIISNE